MVFCVSDVVISFVKKTVAGVAGLLRLRNPLKKREKPRSYEETQVCAPIPFITHAFEIGKGALKLNMSKTRSVFNILLGKHLC